MLVCKFRFGLGLMILLVVAVGCGGDTQAVPHGHDHVEASGVNQPSVTMMPIIEASASEQQAFDQMYESAMADGVISVSELEVFALEAVQCTKRAGFEAGLYEFDSETGAASFIVEAEGPGEEGESARSPGGLASDGCQTTYYYIPWDVFRESHGPTEQEAQLQQEQSEAAVLSCLAEEGFEFDDAMDGLASDEIPEEVYETCVRAYFE